MEKHVPPTLEDIIKTQESDKDNVRGCTRICDPSIAE
jgi:hypothetical protein